MKINKDKLYAFLIVLLISVFAFVVGNIFKESNEKELTELRKIQEEQKNARYQSELREQAANSKSDSFRSVLEKQNIGIGILNDNFKNMNNNILNMKTMYDKNFTDLKNIQNESDHINSASINEQFDFISKYKYKEYSGGTNP
ncbi:Uncharacterised protein [Chryseobacterium gleum]|uniref:Uncharacterized protein n=2 Tax=Chryseobacterium gleum TaxID=250 RepID=A0A3S4NXJ5_CHRGE|nr:hypothetical protein [Chryseobacterium gleum]EFK36786.1 hypothetical protein HMPREF0204_11343 [Chryseobacterium gleum ATCC 35910]QQY32042.1 hypothetical protein I6I60_24970 [Chryseobacterium gleum]VEE10737.1 Uncharacterised protein [Chryseobacterium gleum]